MSRSILIGIVVVIAVAGALGGAWYSMRIPVQVATVQSSDISEYVDQQAKTRLPHVVHITMPYAGRIEGIALREGARIAKDQVVARVSQADLETELAEAEAVVQQLAESIEENEDKSLEQSTYQQALSFVQSMTKTVAAADARTDAGRARMNFAESHLGRLRNLPRGSVADDELEKAELEYQQSKFSYQQDVLLAESIRAIDSATSLLPQMVKEYIARKSLRTEVLQKQKAEAEAQLRQVEIRRERGTMTSPIDGVVLFAGPQNSQFVGAGTQLLTIGDLQQLEVEAEVLSQDVIGIDDGDPVEIYGAAVGATPGQGVPGSISRVYPAGFTKISSLGVEQQRVLVIVQLANESREHLLNLGVGVDFSVRVRIFTEHASGAHVIPRAALFRGPDNQWQVFAVRSGRVRLQTVTVGLMNDQQVQIVSGLNPGEHVVMAPDNTLYDGARVKM